MSWFEFDEINSNNKFGRKLVVTNIQVGTPQLKRYEVEVPFSSKIIDYSFINGPIYYNRYILISINIEGSDKRDLYKLYGEILQWLTSKRGKLRLEGYESYYFLGKVEEISDLQEIAITGNLDIKFNVDPWKYEKEFRQSFILNKNESKSFRGSFMPSVPTITVSNDCNIEFEGKIYNLKKGTKKNFDIIFKNSNNKIKLLTEGPIEFEISYLRGWI